MRITHRVHRRLAGVLAVSLTCLVLGACGSDSEKDEPSQGAGTSAASSDKVPVPEGMVEVELSKDFPAWVPKPKAPHVLVGAKDREEAAGTAEAELVGAGTFVAVYAVDSDLEAEMEHFRESFEQKELSIQKDKPLADVEGNPGMKQGALKASDGTEAVNVVFMHVKGQQPVVTANTWDELMTGQD